jgi:hypothetical protein
LKEEFEAKQKNKVTRRLLAKVDISQLYSLVKGKALQEQLDILSQYLFAQPPTISLPLFQRITRGKTEEEAIQLQLVGLLSLPEYQMC